MCPKLPGMSHERVSGATICLLLLLYPFGPFAQRGKRLSTQLVANNDDVISEKIGSHVTQLDAGTNSTKTKHGVVHLRFVGRYFCSVLPRI